MYNCYNLFKNIIRMWKTLDSKNLNKNISFHYYYVVILNYCILLFFLLFLLLQFFISNSHVRFEMPSNNNMSGIYSCSHWLLNGNKNRAWNVKVHLLRIITRCVQCSRSVDEIPGRGVSSAFLATYERLSCRVANLSSCCSTALVQGRSFWK